MPALNCRRFFIYSLKEYLKNGPVFQMQTKHFTLVLLNTADLKQIFYFIPLLLLACTAGKNATSEKNITNAYETHIDAVKKEYAPDSRTVLFDVKSNGAVLKGETNTPEAKAALLQRLQKEGKTFIDSITILPTAELEGYHHAVVTVSVANLRSKPGHPQELSTQATLGTPLKVWKAQRGWYLVQTPDHYLAWVDGGGIQLMKEAQFAQWQQSQKIIYTQPFGFAYAASDASGATASDLVYGDILQLKKEMEAFYEVQFPDGRTAFIAKGEAMSYATWAATRQPTGQNLVQTAQRLMGLPYLWGGTSFKGVDCSGFTKTVYFMNGLVLPRDASQQVHIGEPVDTKGGWQALQPGDLLFFGTPAKDGKPERVVHVGMWIGGNNEFIHSASKVRISSFNPDAPNYDPSELKRFLRAKRITPQATLYDLRTTAIF